MMGSRRRDVMALFKRKGDWGILIPLLSTKKLRELSMPEKGKGTQRG